MPCRGCRKKSGPFQKAMTSLLPLLGRLNQTTRDKLLPALADGQIGLVIDTKLKSKRFFRAMPAVADPLPMAEPALIFGVSDAEFPPGTAPSTRTFSTP